jgi:hypothetical protein
MMRRGGKRTTAEHEMVPPDAEARLRHRIGVLAAGYQGA